MTVLLDRTGPLPEAAYVAFSAGKYNVGLTVEQARSTHVIVALRLNEEALTNEHVARAAWSPKASYVTSASNGWTVSD